MTNQRSSNREDTGQGAIVVLFLAANPMSTVRLRLDEEVRAIDQVLRRANFRAQFDLREHWAVRAADLQELLLRHRPHIVHFSGHGSPTGELFLQDDQGEAQAVPVEALTQLFAILSDAVRCVVLNACYSASQAAAIADHIDCVIGVPDAIGDAAARAFTAAFYQALAYGRDVATAFDLGCNEINLLAPDEPSKPVLIAPHCDPRQIVLAPGRPAAAVRRSVFAVPIPLPVHYIPRTELLAELRQALLSAAASPASSMPIHALHAMGGAGKSVLARALCDDPAIQAAFPDGILWATVGQTPDVPARLREWIDALSGQVKDVAPTVRAVVLSPGGLAAGNRQTRCPRPTASRTASLPPL